MYYVIETRYVGPNRNNLETDWHNITKGHFFDIQTIPGRTNMSDQEKIYGWLGTTNDWSQTAHGAFEQIEAAENFIKNFVCDKLRKDDEDFDVEELSYLISRYYVGPDNYFDADDWFSVSNSWHDTYLELGDGTVIYPSTTDEELEKLAEECESEAREDGYELWYCLETLERYRDELIENQKDIDYE